jgi:hypothetical protein
MTIPNLMGKNIAKEVIPWITILLLALSFIPGCANLESSGEGSPQPEKARAEIVFQVTLPASQENNPSYFLEVVDEVTGLPFHSTRYSLTSIDNNHYFARIPFEVGSIIKYRYIHLAGIPKIEYTADRQPVRYRLHQVIAPAILEDIVAGWEDQPYSGSAGELIGTVTDTGNAPIPNVMVVIGGERAFTNSEGAFELKGIPVGIQNLAVLSLDGSHGYFEQGAKIAENAVTPARISIPANPMVNITFEVTAPPGDYSGIPMRLIGDLYSLGNTYADLPGGMSTVASRAPQLQYDPNRKIFSTTLPLPAGSFFHYKYSLGDGFWNAELDKNNDFQIRSLTVPTKDLVIQDGIHTFTSSGFAPITLQVVTPADTPPGETASIQMNPFTWMGSIPMWSQGQNQWKYTISSPLNMITQTKFKVCRNDQCGSTDADMSGLPDSFTPASTLQSIPLSINSWLWMDNQGVEGSIPVSVSQKGNEYITGVELQHAYNPSWQPYFSEGFAEIQSLGGNTTILSPTWTVMDQTGGIIAPLPGQDPLWDDLSNQIQIARSFSFKTLVYPSLKFSSPGIWDPKTPKTRSEWDSWFANYRSFLLFFADNASVNLADALILGGQDVVGLLPGEIQITDMNPEEASDYANQKWQLILADIRSHFHGKVFLAIQTGNEKDFPSSLSIQVDGYYLLWNGISSYDSNSNPDSIAAQIANDLPSTLIQELSATGKPVIVGLSIPSAKGPGIDCGTDTATCLPDSLYSPGSSTPQGITLDLQKQVNIYQAALAFFSAQPWVNGIISRGYYPPAALMDLSASIHGKPVSQTISSWFHQLIGIPNP